MSGKFYLKTKNQIKHVCRLQLAHSPPAFDISLNTFFVSLYIMLNCVFLLMFPTVTTNFVWVAFVCLLFCFDSLRENIMGQTLFVD